MEDTNWGALFEQYLDGSISDADRNKLDQELRNNEALLSDFETYKSLKESLALQKIKNNLHAQNYFTPKWKKLWNAYWPYVIASVLVISLLFLWLRTTTAGDDPSSKGFELLVPQEPPAAQEKESLPTDIAPDIKDQEIIRERKPGGAYPQSTSSLHLNEVIADFMEEGIVMRSDSKVVLANILCVDFLVQSRFEECLKCIEQDKNTEGLSIDQKEWLKALSYWGMRDYRQAKTVLESISSESLHEYQSKAKEILENWPPKK